ncbi:transmembrane protein 71-like isoform X1 [Narcine bancroftii]|uniref:transmembrane protein 71-like isoform X1 n=1 Tax=Narcine bancroftii TaxID=1343680 RepID=UPI003831CDD4
MYPGSHYISSSLHATQVLPEEIQNEMSPEMILQRISLRASESSCSPCPLNPLGVSPCMCRRSPRLLTNGYYDISEESFMDEEGNLTLTPSKINVSYKENLVRIFRRRRKARRSFASFFSIDSPSSWLNSHLFSGPDCPLAESSWIGEGSDFDTSFSNKQDPTDADLSTLNKSWLLEDALPLIDAKAYSNDDPLVNRSEGFLDLPSQSQLHPPKFCFRNLRRGPDIKNFLCHLIILALSIGIAAFARCFLGGVIAALITTMLLFTVVLTTAKSAYPCFIKSQKVLHHTQTEIYGGVMSTSAAGSFVADKSDAGKEISSNNT